jgi:hypothetical protein
VVISEKFVWLHLGKTGGNFTHYLFQEYLAEHLLHIDLISDSIKHIGLANANIKYPQYNLLEKDLILNIRKLPSWIISNNRHKIRAKNIKEEKTLQKIIDWSNMGLVYIDEKQDINDLNSWIKPDELLLFCIRDKYPKFFIRTEYLIEDFNKIISQYIPDIKINNGIKPMNVNKDTISFCIEKQNIENVYSTNPIWADLENKLYS